MYPECLKGLIGLTKESSNCLVGSEVSNTSTIGLFIDQDPAFNSCRFADGDTRCDLIQRMIDLREEAYQTVAMDVGAILKGHMKKREEGEYYIGQPFYGPYYSPALVPSNPSIEILTDRLPGGFIRIDRVALMIQPLNGPVVVQLRLYRQDPESLVWSQVKDWDIEVSQISNTARAVTSYTIPCDGRRYRIEYTYDAEEFRVPDSNYHCSCGDVLKSARGFLVQNESKSYGICLYVKVYCDSGQALCNLLNDDIYKMVIGNMIRQKVISLLLQKIFDNQNVNRWTLLSSDAQEKHIADYEASYASRLEWLDTQSDYPVDGFCFKCGGKGAPAMAKYNLLTGSSQ